MFNFLKKKAVVKEESSNADDIRKYAKTKFITPARQKGEKTVTFSASEIHDGLGYNSHFPAVCSAIDARKFLEFARVKLIKRAGVKQGATAKWTFEV
ncbi:MAG: hypothetical protein AB9897_00205 [Anaerolineaceae bacterium]